MKRWAVFAVIIILLASYVVFSQDPDKFNQDRYSGPVFPDRPEGGSKAGGIDPSLEAEYDKPPPSIEVSHNPAKPTEQDNVNITARVFIKVRLEEECIGVFFWCAPTGNWIERTDNWKPRGIKIFVNGEERKMCEFPPVTMKYCKKGAPDYEKCKADNPPTKIAGSCEYLQKFSANSNHTYYAIAYITPPKTVEELAKQAAEEREVGGNVGGGGGA